MKKSAILRKKGLNFTYNLKKNMKIDLNRLKKNAEENKERKISGNFKFFASLPESFNFLIKI